MRTRVATNTMLVFLLVFVSGCVVQSRQLNGLLDLISEPAADLEANSWRVRYSGYESVVYSVLTKDGILFSNSAGDQVLFDGWVVRKVRRMGNNQINIDISDEKNTRIFKRKNRAIAHHSCIQWKRQERLKASLYFQHCSDKQGYKNSILVKNNGDVSVIRQIVDETYNALTLTKLN